MALSKQIYVRIDGEIKAYKVAMIDYRNNEFAVEKDNDLFWYNFNQAYSFYKAVPDKVIGEKFFLDPCEFVAVKSDTDNACAKCCFQGWILSCNQAGDCKGNLRLDGQSVYFVEAKK